MHVKQVQRWVITALVITTAIHFVGGLLLLIPYVGTDSAFWVLTVISAIVMAISIIGALLLHNKRWLSPWLLFAAVPVIISFIWVK
ncbi:hypothetical protein [Nocardioides yefusunii]|uniref:Uncharacterized protein n=1 Tax=Nocardioides yefusunii TaxID=2500546 RepID=A0ABW1QYX3_9ACTN|nr:hypothetical protein [Nocardioides yefusunii]